MNDLSKVKPGDKFTTPGGKVVEIRSKMREGYRILVELTGKEIPVSEDYVKNDLEPYVEDILEEKPEKTKEKPVKKPEQKVEEKPKKETPKKAKEKPVEKPKKKRGRKPGTKNSKNQTQTKGEKKMGKTKTVRKETKKALILDMLKQGPQTRETLANAIIEKGLSKHNDTNKEKSYASVILHTLKKDGSAVVVERGKYVLADQVEDAGDPETEAE